jgi:hypothetical protein
MGELVLGRHGCRAAGVRLLLLLLLLLSNLWELRRADVWSAVGPDE